MYEVAFTPFQTYEPPGLVLSTFTGCSYVYPEAEIYCLLSLQLDIIPETSCIQNKALVFPWACLYTI